MVQVVNIVGGGDLDRELNLTELYNHFHGSDSVWVKFKPRTSSALQLRFEEDGPLCMIYRTGKFVITGGKSQDGIEHTFENVKEAFREIGVLKDQKVELSIYNKVFVGDLGMSLDLAKFAIFAGLEKTEYEPEQTPFLTYRSSENHGVITIASSGKAVINGVINEEQAEEVFRELREEAQSYSKDAI